jgi:hypothetical protein
MYFRSQEMTPQPAANEGGAPGGVIGGGMDTRIIGGVTIGLFAAAVLLLSGMRKKDSE